ncbi:MAG: hypothetical protein M1823_003026 [Watsoniomyces obsoletus]|nr:MAG: hypothetical protein M1823_003026 [Watsoniomyces obsoletus]
MSGQSTKLDLAVVLPPYIGSILSTLGAGFVLVCYAFLPQAGHIRHALIINLALADFVNALTNTISGSIILVNKYDFRDGPGCTANGFIRQLSVQGTDCSIFTIAVVTIFIIRTKYVIPDSSKVAKLAVCGVVWLLPMATSAYPTMPSSCSKVIYAQADDGHTIKGFTALGLGLYHPVTGNWCWIQAKPVYYRYVLTHMWRFLFIALSTGIYAYAYFYVNRHFKRLRFLGSRNNVGFKDEDGFDNPLTERNNHTFSPSSHQGIMVSRSFTCQELHASQHKTHDNHNKESASSFSLSSTKPMTTTARYDLSATEAHIKKMLLLNAYPIWYIILWIPGIAYRFVEATGNTSRVLVILQASSQFIGLANAISYGLNERILGQLKQKFR